MPFSSILLLSTKRTIRRRNHRAQQTSKGMSSLDIGDIRTNSKRRQLAPGRRAAAIPMRRIARIKRRTCILRRAAASRARTVSNLPQGRPRRSIAHTEWKFELEKTSKSYSIQTRRFRTSRHPNTTTTARNRARRRHPQTPNPPRPGHVRRIRMRSSGAFNFARTSESVVQRSGPRAIH